MQIKYTRTPNGQTRAIVEDLGDSISSTAWNKYAALRDLLGKVNLAAILIDAEIRDEVKAPR